MRYALGEEVVSPSAVERHLHERAHGTAAYVAARSFFAAWVSCDVKAVVPGQPIPFTWSFHTLRGTGLDPGSVTARIYLAVFNTELYQSPPAMLVAGTYGLDTLPQNGLIAPPPAGGVASELYRIGTKTLRLDVTSDKTGAVFSTDVDLEVVADQPAVWQWTAPEGTPDPSHTVVPISPLQLRYGFLINHEYRLAGRMHNTVHNPNVTITGSLTVLETPFGKSDTTQIDTASFTIPPGSHQDYLFAPIRRNWGWLIRAIWVRNFSEPLVKTFTYSVRFAFSDSYGNVYPEQTVSGLIFPLTIDISVSDEKRAYASAALAALGVGLVVAIFTFGAGLSQAIAVANGLGERALDPPQPDWRYKDRVAWRNTQDADVPTDSRLVELVQVLTAAARIVSLIEVRADIYNRLLGARLAKDSDAIRLQRDSYREIEMAIVDAVREHVELTRHAVTVVARQASLSRDEVEPVLRRWQRQGIPPAVSSELVAGGCSEEALATVRAALQHTAAMDVAQDLPKALNLLTESLALAARESHGREAGDGNGRPGIRTPNGG